MIRLFGHTSAKPALVMVCVLLLTTGCHAPNHEGFAVYLTQGDVLPAAMPALSHVDIAEQPVVSTSDIIAYDAETHEITLTAKAFGRISSLEVPVGGKSFVVCVDRKPVYWGAFWTPISSISFDGVTILKPLSSHHPEVIRLELGYPSPSLYRGEDPRNSTEVLESLERDGKLTAMPSATTADALPHSMKGYELYSWLEDGQWHFTLTTGTNRKKSLQEVVSDDDIVSQDGWVRIHVVGADAITAVLSRLPRNEYVFWLATLRSEQASQGGANIALPPRATVDAVREYAERCGLVFQVQT